MNIVRLGLIGAGRWGRNYIRALAEIKEASLGRLASRNPESQTLVPESCAVSSDWKAVCEAEDIEGVILAVPPAFQIEMATVALGSGKAVLLEKPLSLSLSEAEEFQRLVEDAGGLVVVGHTHLFSPAYMRLKEMAASMGAVRGIVSVGGNFGPFRPETPPLWDYAPHDIALCLDFMGQKPLSVSADRKSFAQTEEGYGEVVDITLTFPGGIKAAIRAGNLFETKERRFEVQFDDGALVYDDLAADKLMRVERAGASEKEKRLPVPVNGDMPLVCQIRHFCETIHRGHDTSNSLTLGVEIVRAIAACENMMGDIKNVVKM